MKKHNKKKLLSAQKRKKEVITCKRIVVILYNRMHFSTFLREFFFYLFKLVKEWVVKSQPSIVFWGYLVHRDLEQMDTKVISLKAENWSFYYITVHKSLMHHDIQTFFIIILI
jgi:hypothetical protein